MVVCGLFRECVCLISMIKLFVIYKKAKICRKNVCMEATCCAEKKRKEKFMRMSLYILVHACVYDIYLLLNI